MFYSFLRSQKKKKRRKKDSLLHNNVQVFNNEQVTSFGTNLGHLYLDDYYF